MEKKYIKEGVVMSGCELPTHGKADGLVVHREQNNAPTESLYSVSKET